MRTARSEHSVIATTGNGVPVPVAEGRYRGTPRASSAECAFSFPDNACPHWRARKNQGEKMTDTGPRADTRDMYMVHAAFRREFGALPDQVRNVHAGDIQRSQAIGDHIACPTGQWPCF
jgi:hypothetical protein